MYRRITSLFSFLLLSSHCWMASVWALVSPDVPRCSFPPGDYGRVVKDSNELNSILSFWTTQRGACQGLLRLKAGRTYHLSQEYVFDGPYNIKLTGGQRGAAAKASLAAPATIVKASTAVRHFSFVAGARIAMKGLRFLGSEMPGLRVPAYSQLCPTPFTSQPQDFGGAILLYSCPGRSRSQGTFTGVEFAGNHNRVGGAVAAGPWSSTRFDRCRFVQNAVQGVCNFYKSRDECTGTGGALALFDDTYVSDCTFEGNAAAEGGGGLYFCPRGDSSVVTVEGSRFYRNTVGFYGGAIALEDMATLSVDFPCGLGALTVRDSEFVGNVGVNGEILGGGIYNGQTLYLSCSWVVGNEAMDASGLSSTWGGGLYLSAHTTPSRTAISGVVFELNSADYGNDIFVETGSTLTSVVVRSCETLQVSSATVLPQCEDLSCVRTTDNAQWGLLTKSRRNATSTCKALCKNATPPQESAQCYYIAPPLPASGFVVA